MTDSRLESATTTGLSRRRFIGTGLAVAALAHSGSLQAVVPRTVVGVALGDAPAADAFFAALPSYCVRWARDLTEVVQAMLYTPDAALPDILVGLSRDAEHQIISQLALERRYLRSFVARHRLSAAGIEHRASGRSTKLLQSVGTMAARGEAWPIALARAAAGNFDLQSTEQHHAGTAAVAYPVPDHLVSWVYVREGAST